MPTDPTLILVTTTAAIPREGEGASHYAYEAEFQRATAWRAEALRCQAKLSEQDKMIRMQADEINGRISWLARIEAAANDVFALRYMANMTLDTAIYKLWLATEGTPSLYPAVVVPTAPVPNLEAENASLRAELAQRDDLIAHYEIAEKGWQEENKSAEAKNAALIKQNEFLLGVTAEQEKEIADLRTQLAEAQNDEPIGDAFGEDASDEEEAFVKALPTVAEVVDAHDKVVNGALGRLVAHADKATITSLRAQLARGAAIEEAARAIYATGDELFGHIEGGFSLYHDGRASDELAAFRDALVAWPLASSPGPRGTAEGESRESMAKRYQDALNQQGGQLVETHRKLNSATARLAILERVAKHAKGYVNAELGKNHMQNYASLRSALAELDVMEAQS